MSLNTLYKAAVLKNIVDWNIATEPTEDSYAVGESVELSFNKQLKEFIKEEPSHPISVFNKETIVSDELEEKRIQASQKLWKKYLAMRKDKSPADKEYFAAFNELISVKKEILKFKNLPITNSMFFNDNRLGKADFVMSIVTKMANISKEFLKTQPKNTITPLKEIAFEDIIKYIESFTDIGYKVSDKNGSFMTALDQDNSRIHISSNKNNLFDTASSVTHEVGHALYQNRILNKKTEIGKLGQCISLSLHESSSIVNEISLAGIDFNVTQNRNNIYRLGADKVHYIIHIFIRMKVEELLFTDQIKAEDLSATWNSLVEEYIGMTPENDWEGFLQDVHWNDGAFGYFQSYAIGFFNAVTMYEQIKNDLTDNMVTNTEQVILKKIDAWYGHYNEDSFNILEGMHPDIEKSLEVYKDFIFNNFTRV